MYYRRKLLILLLEMLGGSSPATDFQKYLFLFSQLQKNPDYSFVPHKFGCFSFQSYADKRALIQQGVLLDTETWKLSNQAVPDLEVLQEDKLALKNLAGEHLSRSGKDLVVYVYKTYPYYATRSEIAKEILSRSDFSRVQESVSRESSGHFFTIGYEGRSIDQYLDTLIRQNVQIICDVRRNPLSRKYGFSKNQLSNLLNAVGIEYLHMPELGIASSERKNLNSTQDYQTLFKKYEKETLKQQRQSLSNIKSLLSEKGRTAITCFEADPSFCHRGRVASALASAKDFSVPITHL